MRHSGVPGDSEVAPPGIATLDLPKLRAADDISAPLLTVTPSAGDAPVCPPTHGDNHSGYRWCDDSDTLPFRFKPRVIGRSCPPLSPRFPKLVYHRRITGNYASRAPLPQPGSSFISRTSPGAETLRIGPWKYRSFVHVYRNTGTDRAKKERATRIRSFSFRPPATPVRADVKHRTGGSMRERSVAGPFEDIYGFFLISKE